MKMAEKFQISFASTPVRGDQFYRIDFEMALWVFCNIGRQPDFGY